jgi:Pyruvate/2-oxoacid:ferredoxin oxidoreductase delta subunit
MGIVDLTKAERPTRNRVGGANTERAAHFRKRMPPSARRSVFMREAILLPQRETPVNPNRTEIDDAAETTRFIKALAREMGADAVGIAAFDPRLTFTQSDQPDHQFVIVFAMTMAYDFMAEIGPRSQEEVHRVYYLLDDLGVRLAHQIGAFGYRARMQPNGGDIPMPAYGYLAGLGELGKHGSLISPVLGSSFRLCAVTTDMPLIADGPQDHGIDEICTSCRICARFCPGDAIGHDKKTVNGVTRWHIDTPACEPYFHKLYGCKICLMVCPFNARGALKERYKPIARDIRAAKTAEGLLALIEQRTDLRTHEFGYKEDQPA